MFGFLGFPYKWDCYLGVPDSNPKPLRPQTSKESSVDSRPTGWKRNLETSSKLSVKPVIDALHGWPREPTSSGVIEAGWT